MASFFSVVDTLFVLGMKGKDVLVGLGSYFADKTKISVVVVRFVGCWYFVAVDWKSMAQHGVDAALLGK